MIGSGAEVCNSSFRELAGRAGSIGKCPGGGGNCPIFGARARLYVLYVSADNRRCCRRRCCGLSSSLCVSDA